MFMSHQMGAAPIAYLDHALIRQTVLNQLPTLQDKQDLRKTHLIPIPSSQETNTDTILHSARVQAPST